MADSSQGAGSSPALATFRRRLRKRLRKLDSICAAAQRLVRFQRAIGRDFATALRVYHRHDMERMEVRRKLKEFGVAKVRYEKENGK